MGEGVEEVARVGAAGDGDPAYPTITPPDAVYPCQTRAAMSPPLDQVITPALWSRLERPLERALGELWDGLGLLARWRPSRGVAIHFGRIAVNAHAWERLRAAVHATAPDPALVGPAARGLARLPEVYERARARVRRPGLVRRLRAAESAGRAALDRAERRRAEDLDTAELARGPLDARLWTELLLPWLAGRLRPPGPTAAATERVRRAVGIEERGGAEVGRRLTANGHLDALEAVAFLTVAERLRAVHEAAPVWAELARARRERFDRFLGVDVPVVFWGRPRVEVAKNG